MSAITGTWKDGRIILDGPTDWAEGCRVLVEPVQASQSIGMREEDWTDSPEAINEWLGWYDSLEPLEITPEEESDLAVWRHELKDYELARMHQRVDGLFE